jgi:hypothetical protein
MGLVLVLIGFAIALVVVGLLVEGLFRLLILGAVVLVLALGYAWLRRRRRPRR